MLPGWVLEEMEVESWAGSRYIRWRWRIGREVATGDEGGEHCGKLLSMDCFWLGVVGDAGGDESEKLLSVDCFGQFCIDIVHELKINSPQFQLRGV